MAPPPPPPPPATIQAPPPPSNLLKSIEKGTKLRKVETNDRSKPLVEVPKSAAQNNRTPMVPMGNRLSPPSQRAGGIGASQGGIGGLFAGGIPQLKPVGGSSLVNTTANGNREPIGF